MENTKKPFYKKWWFWVIIIVLAIAGLGYNQSRGGKDDDTLPESSSTTDDDNEDFEKETADNFEVGTKEWLEFKVDEVLSGNQLISVTHNAEDDSALIKFNGLMNLTTKMTINGMYGDIFEILNAIQDGVIGDINFNVVYPLNDVYGNSEDTIVMKASFRNDTIKRINFSGASYKNIPTMADSWWNHPSVTMTE